MKRRSSPSWWQRVGVAQRARLWPVLVLLSLVAILGSLSLPIGYAQGGTVGDSASPTDLSPLPDTFLFAIGAQAPVGQFNRPSGVAVAADGTVYVADTWNNRIQRFSATGAFLGAWGSLGSGNGQFSSPSGVAVAADGTVYVADTYNHRIQRFTATGAFLGVWGSLGRGTGQFGYPSGVAVAADGTVYVADYNNHRIQRFSATGEFLGVWGSPGSGNGQFWYPSGVAVAADGTVYVADAGNSRIQRFTAAGAFLGAWGSEGSGTGQFWYPYGVAVAADGTVYVADTWNHRIQAFGTAYPTTWRGEYFANRWLAEAPVLIRQEDAIDFDWGTGSPGPGIPADNFSARWQRYVWFAAGTYRFTVVVNGGVRLWLGNELIVEAWQDQEATVTVERMVSAGYRLIRLDYFDEAGAARVSLSWAPSSAPWQSLFLPVIVSGR